MTHTNAKPTTPMTSDEVTVTQHLPTRLPSMAEVRQFTFNDLENNPKFKELCDEYAAESSIEGMPPTDPHLPMYRQLEAAGVLHAFGAFSGDELVGFLLMLVSPVPHYSAVIANTESFFVRDGHRKGGTGSKLLKMAEEHAKHLGAVGIFVSAPSGGRLSRAIRLFGFRETNQVFFRKLT